MIHLLVACATTPATDTGEAVVADPVAQDGVYAITMAQEWVGECELDDPATYEAPEQEWTFDVRGAVIVLYPDFWTPYPGTLEGMEFDIDTGSWSADRMQVTRLVEGVFEGDTVSGARVLELDCGGNGCDTLKDTYGRKLDFPCRSEAAFQGTLLTRYD